MAKVINNSKAKLQAFEKANEVLVPVPLSQPTPLINAIAELGNFTPPPPNPPTIAPAVATIPYGYPIIQAQTIESGGLPVQRLETNGLFNLVSSFIKYWSQGGATKFDNTFGIAPGQGYTQGSVLYYADPTNTNNPINGWYTKLNNNVDTTALPNANWKRITGLPVIGSTTINDTTIVDTTPDAPITVPATSLQFIGATVAADTTDTNKAIITIPTPSASLGLYQQGRLTGVSGSPYGDTTGNTTLYFTPTEQGNLISLYNTTTQTWVTQTFTETTQNISGLSGEYDIYITSSSTSATGITITPIEWTNNAPTNRTRLANGRWVYTGAPQSMLVGSINVSGGVVQSWTGNRSIWNLYNQVSKPLVASQGSINIRAATLIWYLWSFSTANTGGSPNWRNQWYDNGNSTTDGYGRFSFLLDPLYNKGLLLSYIGTGTSGSGSDNLQVGIIANASAGSYTSGIIALAFSTQNSDATGTPGVANNVNILTYSYNYNSSSNGYTTGLNYIQKIEFTFGSGASGFGFGNGSDTGGGLTAEFWG